MSSDREAMREALLLFNGMLLHGLLPDPMHTAVREFCERETVPSGMGRYRPASDGAAEITERSVTETCVHPYRAVFWNPSNQVVQCHRCGEVIAKRAPSSPEGS